MHKLFITYHIKIIGKYTIQTIIWATKKNKYKTPTKKERNSIIKKYKERGQENLIYEGFMVYLKLKGDFSIIP